MSIPSITVTSGGGTSVVFNNPKNSSAFGFTFAVGACAPAGTLTAAGTLQGYCGHSAGQGSDTSGHLFSYTSIGTLLIITGELVGVATAVPTPATGSCLHQGTISVAGTTVLAGNLPGGATAFQVQGAVARVNCNVGGTLVTTLATPTLQVVLGIPIPHLHVSYHFCVMGSVL